MSYPFINAFLFVFILIEHKIKACFLNHGDFDDIDDFGDIGLEIIMVFVTNSECYNSLKP